MKKIFLFIAFVLTFFTISAQSPDTAVITAAAALYQPKANKNGVPISPTAPLPIHQKADNKLMFVKSQLNTRIDSTNTVVASKLSTSNAISTFLQKATYQFDTSVFLQQQRDLLANNINYVRGISDTRDDSLKAALNQVKNLNFEYDLHNTGDGILESKFGAVSDFLGLSAQGDYSTSKFGIQYEEGDEPRIVIGNSTNNSSSQIIATTGASSLMGSSNVDSLYKRNTISAGGFSGITIEQYIVNNGSIRLPVSGIQYSWVSSVNNTNVYNDLQYFEPTDLTLLPRKYADSRYARSTKGTTANRPILTNTETDKGYIYFNTDTSKFQGWTGTAWVDFH